MIITLILTLPIYSCSKTAKVGTCLLDINNGNPYIRKIIDSSKSQCTTQYLNDVKDNSGNILHKSGELLTFDSTSLYPGCSGLIENKYLGLKIVDCPK